MACSQEYRRILKSRKHASTSQPEDGLASDEETSWQWTEWEDELVITNRVAGKTYGEISRLLPSRTANAVAARWNNHLQKRRLEDTFTASENRWSQQEDQLLVSLHIAGEKFAEIAQKIPNRSVSSCRTRWQKLVGCRPELLKRWTILEKNTLESLFNILGPRWHDIAKELPGRTHQACERHYYHELDCGDKVEASGPSREDWISHWNSEFLVHRLLILLRKDQANKSRCSQF